MPTGLTTDFMINLKSVIRYTMKLTGTKLVLLLTLTGCSFKSAAQNHVNWWLTTNNKISLLAGQKPILPAEKDSLQKQVIIVDPLHKYQQMDGFGFALTGGSAQHMIHMSPGARKKLIQELFGTMKPDIGISYLRLSIGASDMNDHTFSYDDMPPGEKDPELKNFSLREDEKDVILVLKEILAVNPSIKILGSPWSAPLWMKTNENIQGGKLKEEDYAVYAHYFVKYILEMKQHGILIDAVTVQNEPFNDGNTPSMSVFAKEELKFIRDHLGPAFERAGIKTKIILFDHNCDAPEYSISVLSDSRAAKFVNGSGFHLYAGKISALSKVHKAFPEKAIYFTEQMVVSKTDFNTAKPVSRILIGATRNWSRNVILWNLAADQNNRPHTDNGGCGSCQGAITIEGDSVSRNLAYYTLAHASKFVAPDSYRIDSSIPEGLENVAFMTPAGKIVLIVANNSPKLRAFTISVNGLFYNSSLAEGSVGTYVW